MCTFGDKFYLVAVLIREFTKCSKIIFVSLLIYTHNFFTSLVFTDVVETITLFLLVRFALRKKGIATKDLIFAGLFASFATITYVWYVFPVMIPRSVMAPTFVSEPFVFLVEALFYRMYLRLSWKEALMVSLIANTASYLGGIGARVAHLWIYW